MTQETKAPEATDDELLIGMDYSGLAEELANDADRDMTKVQAAFVRELPVEGPTRVRLVAYIELGKHAGEFKGQKKTAEKALLVFELSGPKHPPIELPDGTKRPHLVYEDINFSRNEKAGIMKLFNLMNAAHGKPARHIVQFLDPKYAFKAKVYHRKYKRKDGSEGTAVGLSSKDNGWSLEAPVRFDDETGETYPLTVEPARTPIRCFVWDKPTPAMWKSIFIDGTWDEKKDEKTGAVTRAAESKNKYQLMIQKALNYSGSKIEAMLAGLGEAAPKADTPPKDDAKPAAGVSGNDEDPLAGISGA